MFICLVQVEPGVDLLRMAAQPQPKHAMAISAQKTMEEVRRVASTTTTSTSAAKAKKAPSKRALDREQRLKEALDKYSEEKEELRAQAEEAWASGVFSPEVNKHIDTTLADFAKFYASIAHELKKPAEKPIDPFDIETQTEMLDPQVPGFITIRLARMWMLFLLPKLEKDENGNFIPLVVDGWCKSVSSCEIKWEELCRIVWRERKTRLRRENRKIGPLIIGLINAHREEMIKKGYVHEDHGRDALYGCDIRYFLTTHNHLGESGIFSIADLYDQLSVTLGYEAGGLRVGCLMNLDQGDAARTVISKDDKGEQRVELFLEILRDKGKNFARDGYMRHAHVVWSSKVVSGSDTITYHSSACQFFLLFLALNRFDKPRQEILRLMEQPTYNLELHVNPRYSLLPLFPTFSHNNKHAGINANIKVTRGQMSVRVKQYYNKFLGTTHKISQHAGRKGFTEDGLTQLNLRNGGITEWGHFIQVADKVGWAPESVFMMMRIYAKHIYSTFEPTNAHGVGSRGKNQKRIAMHKIKTEEFEKKITWVKETLAGGGSLNREAVEYAAALLMYYTLVPETESITQYVNQFTDMVDLRSYVVHMMVRLTCYNTDLHTKCFIFGCSEDFSHGVLFAELRGHITEAHRPRAKEIDLTAVTDLERLAEIEQTLRAPEEQESVVPVSDNQANEPPHADVQVPSDVDVDAPKQWQCADEGCEKHFKSLETLIRHKESLIKIECSYCHAPIPMKVYQQHISGYKKGASLISGCKTRTPEQRSAWMQRYGITEAMVQLHVAKRQLEESSIDTAFHTEFLKALERQQLDIGKSIESRKLLLAKAVETQEHLTATLAKLQLENLEENTASENKESESEDDEETLDAHMESPPLDSVPTLESQSRKRAKDKGDTPSPQTRRQRTKEYKQLWYQQKKEERKLWTPEQWADFKAKETLRNATYNAKRKEKKKEKKEKNTKPKINKTEKKEKTKNNTDKKETENVDSDPDFITEKPPKKGTNKGKK